MLKCMKLYAFKNIVLGKPKVNELQFHLYRNKTKAFCP